MTPSEPTASALSTAVGRLYEAFARYPVGSAVVGCSCCVSQDAQRELARAELREVPADLLRRYAFKAMTTWGSAADFKHFLPAIWDRMTSTDLGVDEQIVYGKLVCAEWVRWPSRERAPILEITCAWLASALAGGHGDLRNIVESAGVAEIEIVPLLAVLDQSAGPCAATQIARLAPCVRGDATIRWNWWKSNGDHLLARWMIERGAARLEATFLEHSDHADARRWSDAAEQLSRASRK